MYLKNILVLITSINNRKRVKSLHKLLSNLFIYLFNYLFIYFFFKLKVFKNEFKFKPKDGVIVCLPQK
jgi:hypothetical protein